MPGFGRMKKEPIEKDRVSLPPFSTSALKTILIMKISLFDQKVA